MAHQIVSSVHVTTEGQCGQSAMPQDGAFVVGVSGVLDVTAANQDTTPSPTVKSASAMAPGSPTLCALLLASAFVFLTMLAQSATAVHLATTDTRTVLPAIAHTKARMETRATRCRASAYVSQGWWANSVTIALLDSGSPTAQLTLLFVTQRELSMLIPRRAPVAATQMWRGSCVTNVNLSTGIWPLTIPKDA